MLVCSRSVAFLRRVRTTQQRREIHRLPAHALSARLGAKPPFGGPEHVLHYLARYTHRVAISNHRLLSVSAAEVSFRWKDYTHHGRQRELTLTSEEFLR